MIELMLRGRELKVIKGHNMNERSSRSHCIFTIIVENSTKMTLVNISKKEN